MDMSAGAVSSKCFKGIRVRAAAAAASICVLCNAISAAAQDAAAPKNAATEKQPPPNPKRYKDYHFQQNVECPYCQFDPAHPTAHRGLHWHNHWSRVGLFEYISTPALFGTALAVRLLVKDSNEPSWRGPILFDQPARDVLVFQTFQGRANAGYVSDAIMYASVAYPILVDNIAVTWIGREKPDVAWQMFWINAQSYALTAALVEVVKRATNRERPWGDRCPNDTLNGPDVHLSVDPTAASSLSCNSAGRFRSFYSGHAAFTATGAALVCTHHTQLELYKNPTADTATCLTAVAATTATGVLRMTSDNHWASDVLTGHLMGFVSGYVVPTLLFYHKFQLKPEPVHEEDVPKEAPKPQFAMFPIVTPNGAMLNFMGMY